MIIYSVTIILDPTIQSDWEDWMRRVHIPEVLETRCFTNCRMYRVEGACPNEPTYVVQYQSPDLAAYHRYRDHFAPALQKNHTERYSGKFRGSRQVLEEIAEINQPGA